MNRIGLLAGFVTSAIVSSAHIGSPDVFYDGTAGPYRVHVRVSPPTVVPGVAPVFVRTSETDIDSISIQPVYWRAGAQGAPTGEMMTAVAGQRGSYSGKLWLMARGSYSVYVSVFGARGNHTATVPLMAQATTRLGLTRTLAAVLIVLGLLLVSGLIAIVRAAASDSLVEPTHEPDQVARRRGSLAAIIALPLLILALVGGARWWKAEDALFRRTMYRPFFTTALVTTGPGANMLRMSVSDTTGMLSAPMMLDHGKIMHLFLVKESSMSTFVHLHPSREPAGVFVSALPPIATGRYLVYGDLVLETGAEYTVTTTVEVPETTIDTTGDPDDSWIEDSFGVPATAGARAHLTNNIDLQWDHGDSVVSGRDVDLMFSVRDRKGAVLPIEPYLGMAAHAVVLREDASVFIHLHPMGTVSMASQQAFAQRDRGDTTPAGRLGRVAAPPPMAMSVPAVTIAGVFSFPYAFPRPGRYRVWIQVKLAGKVRTATYEVDVG